MITDFHFLRPYWLLIIIPLFGIFLLLLKKEPKLRAWSEICDPDLLTELIKRNGERRKMGSIVFFFFSMLLMILSGAGPAWYKLPVVTYKPIHPIVFVLDMSEDMMDNDLTPNRLSRAKFKLHDLMDKKSTGQFGLVVFTSEPFIVSPLTEDGQTILSLLSSLTPDIMPVNGQDLTSALREASLLIRHAGFNQGKILVLSSSSPSREAIILAKKLANSGIYSSVMPVTGAKNLNPLFQQFANAGEGEVVPFSLNSNDLNQWLSTHNKNEYAKNEDNDIPLWRDEGRWLLIPALIFLLPLFRRGWMERIVS